MCVFALFLCGNSQAEIQALSFFFYLTFTNFMSWKLDFLNVMVQAGFENPH
jgi:hypothetical protein